jgi:hypothetical protein
LLASLSDREIASALGFIRAEAEVTAGTLLLFGGSEALRRFLPTHEAAFQVLRGLQVEVNDFLPYPLLRLAEEMFARFQARNTVEELQPTPPAGPGPISRDRQGGGSQPFTGRSQMRTLGQVVPICSPTLFLTLRVNKRERLICELAAPRIRQRLTASSREGKGATAGTDYAAASAVQKNSRSARSWAAASMISLAVVSVSVASPALAFSVG